MKNIMALFFSVVILMAFPANTFAQHKKAKINIVDVKKKDQLVHFDLTSSKPFIFGNNRYILHIGNKEFYRNKQSAHNGVGHMTFLIDEDAFNALPEGVDIYLTYGKVSADDMDMDAMNKADFEPLWSLGKFSKTLLTK